MRVALAADHAGFTLKEIIKEHLICAGHDVADCGAFDGERSDYPDFARQAASRVSKGVVERAVLVCGSGIGMCMTANRFAGVRAVVVREPDDAELSRRHNDANVMCLGARMTGDTEAIALVDLFLSLPFDGGRHAARVKKMEVS